jgi:hypothetical protein
MANGRIDTTHIDLGTLDTNYVAGLRTRAGLDVGDLISRLSAELQALNGGVDPLIADLIYPTTATEAGAPTEVRGFQARKRGEYVPGRPQYGERALNHMLPIDDWEITIGYTEDKLKDIKLAEFDAQNRGLRAAWELLYRQQVLTRLFGNAEVAVSPRSTATSPGFAGSGTGANVFAGIFPDNQALPAGYTHYLRDTLANIAPMLLTGVKLLRRWYRGPFDLIASAAVVDAIAALPTPTFVPAGSMLVRPGQGTAEALVDAAQYVGVLHGDIRVHMALTDFTDANWALYKTSGALNVNNPLAWRYDDLYGRDVEVHSRAMFPLADANSIQRFGIGVNNRTAAVLGSIGAGTTYVPPTI